MDDVAACDEVPELPDVPPVDPDVDDVDPEVDVLVFPILPLPVLTPPSSSLLAAFVVAGKTVAPDVSVVFAVVDLDGTESATAFPPANEPPELMDSAARESEVMWPARSVMSWVALGA